MLGDAFVVVSPDTAAFRAKASAEIRTALAGIHPDIPVGLNIDRNVLGQFLSAAQKAANIKINADTTTAVADILALKARIEALSKSVANIPIGADDTKGLATIAGFQAKLAAITSKLTNVQIGANDAAAVAKIAGLQAQIDKMTESLEDIEINPDVLAGATKIAGLQAQATKLRDILDNMPADVIDTAAVAKLNLLEAEIEQLGRDLDLPVDVDTIAALTKIAALKAQLALLVKQAEEIKIGISTTGLLAAEAQVLGVEAAVKGFSKAMSDASDAESKAGEVGKTLAGAWSFLPQPLAAISAEQRAAHDSAQSLYGVWGLLNARVSLFGGLLGNFLPGLVTWVHAWHIAADGVLEFAAVWIPAAVGLGVFAAAASQGVETLQTHISDMLTVVNSTPGTLQKIFPLTGGFLAMQNAVQPAVYELWGDAIAVAGSKSGVLLTLVQKLVPVIDQLGARTTAALESGGLEVFTKNSVADIQGLGTAFGNFFGIIGNLIKVVPGYAGILLQLGTGFLGIIEHVTAAIGPVLEIGLALHGAILYTGLLVTVLLLLESGLQKLGLAVIGGITDLVGWGVAAVAAAGATTALDAAFAIMGAVNPFVWVAVAVAAIGGLIYLLHGVKSATEEWGDAMQTSIKNATSLSDGITQVTNDQTQVTAKLTTAQNTLSNSTQKYTEVATGHGGVIRGVTQAYQDQAAKVSQLQGVQSQLSSETDLYNTRVGDLAQKYGGTSNALALLNAAGITNTQIFDKSGSTWAQIQIQVQGAANGIKSLANVTGVAGNSLQALDRQITSPSGADVSAIQKVTTAMDALVTATTDTQSTFDTYGLGLDTLSSSSATFSNHLGSLTVKGTVTKTAIDSLSQAGLNLNQAFTSQVGNTSKLIDTWRSAGVSANLFVGGIAASIAPLEKYAKGSSEATAQLVALGEEAGYQGPNNLADLNKFLGITSGALKDTAGETKKVKDVADQATIQEALLTSAMQNQGSFISSTLLGDISSAVLKYNGVSKAVSAYGVAVAQSGKGSTAANNAMTAAVEAIVKSELKLGDTSTQMGAIVAKVFGVSMPAAMKLVQAALNTTAGTSTKVGVSISGDFVKQAKSAQSASTELNAYTTAVLNNGTSAASTKTARAQLVTDLIAAGVNSKTANTDVADYTKAIVNNATDTAAAKAARQQLITDVVTVGGDSKTTNTALSNYTSAVVLNGVNSTQAKAARQQLITDLKNQDVNSKTANTDVNNYTKTITANGVDTNAAKAARQQLITDILNSSKNAVTGRTDLANYTAQVQDNGVKAAAQSGARAKLIADLKQAGLNSQAATSLVNGLTKSIQLIPGGKQVGITVTGKGTWSISQGEALQKALISGTSFAPKGAGGGIMPGYAPGHDSLFAQVSPGEGILVPEAVKAIGPGNVMALNHMFGSGRVSKGFGHAGGGIMSAAGGGVVSGNVGGLGPYLDTQYGNTVAAMTQSVADAMTGAIDAAVSKAKAAAASAGGTYLGAGSGNYAADITTVLKSLGLPLSLVANWMRQIQTESGGNLNAVNRTDINAQEGHPCVTVNTVILTRRGWMTWDNVRTGDETIGYNPVAQRSEWTRVTGVHYYPDAEVWRIGNKRWHADVTPNHRWWSDTETVLSPENLTECPECGWAGRTDRAGLPAATPRSISTHRGRMHGVKPVATTSYRGEFVQTQDLGSHHRVRLAAAADTDGIPGLSLEDVRVIAWLQGDGSITPVLAKPQICPECNWTPGGNRKNRSPDQPANSVAVHRARVHGMGKGQTKGELAGYDGRIWQSKPEQIVKLRALLAHTDHTEINRGDRGRTGHLEAYCFLLRRAYVTDLLKRSQLMETGPEAFVLALSPDQRAAWLDSMIDAEGNRQIVESAGARRGGSGEFVRIAQVDGPLQEAIKLAVYLEGYRPTYARLARREAHHKPAGQIGMARPHIAPQMFTAHETLERQPVWCVTTELGTWTAEQNDGIPFLTGNSVGLLQLIPGTFAAYAGPYRNTPPLVNYGGGTVSENPMAQIYAGIHYANAVYHGAAMSQIIGAGHGYSGGGLVADSGTTLSPGWNMRYNGTGRPEHLTRSGGHATTPGHAPPITAGENAILEELRAHRGLLTGIGPGLAGALNGVAGRSGQHGSYSTRR